MWRIVCLAFIFALAIGAAQASPPTSPPSALALAVNASVSQWMTNYSVADAEVAVAHDGALEGSFAHGWQPTERRPVASLSKGITGICIADLIADNKLAFTDTLGALLAPFFKQHGEPADPRFKSISIEELLTHRTGLPRNAVDDALDHTMEQSVASAAQVTQDSDPGTAVAYSDTGYLILGFVAEQVAKRAYFPLCSGVLEKAGLPPNSGVIDPTLAARAPNGGWAISAETYVKFLAAFSQDSTVLGPAAAKWMEEQKGDPAYAAGPCPRFAGKPAYGLGVCIRRTKYGLEYYHDGLLHHDKYYPKTGGSFFFINANGEAAVVIFSGENSGKAYKSLETAVMNTMASETVGPSQVPAN
jgi:CubicO group peptidase (beta-lactamase class C family)